MLNSKVFTFLSIAVLSFIIYGILKERPKVLDIKNEVKQVRLQIAEIKDNNDKIRGLLGYLKSQIYLEKEAKLKLNLKKPDEEVVIVKKQEEDKNQKSNSKNPADVKALVGRQNDNSKNKNIFNKIGDWFSKILSREI